MSSKNLAIIFSVYLITHANETLEEMQGYCQAKQAYVKFLIDNSDLVFGDITHDEIDQIPSSEILFSQNEKREEVEESISTELNGFIPIYDDDKQLLKEIRDLNSSTIVALENVSSFLQGMSERKSEISTEETHKTTDSEDPKLDEETRDLNDHPFSFSDDFKNNLLKLMEKEMNRRQSEQQQNQENYSNKIAHLQKMIEELQAERIKEREDLASLAADKIVQLERDFNKLKSKSDQISNRYSKLRDRLTCVICQSHRRDTLLLPCGHLVTCSLCSQKVINTKPLCPICRGNISEMKFVIFS